MHTREAYCHLLASVLAADGMMTDDERAVLHGAFERHALTPEERQRVRDLPDLAVAISVMASEPEDVRRGLVDELVEAALVDGKLSPNETAEVKRLAAALGV